MVIKIFALLLTVNLFSVMAKAEASEYVDYSVSENNRAFGGYNSATGDEEILIEKDLSARSSLLRVASMLGSQWFNDAISLKRPDSEEGQVSSSRYPYSLKESLAQAHYGVDVGSNEFSVSMKVKF